MGRRIAVLLITASLLACGPGTAAGPFKTLNIGAVIDRTGTNAEPSWGDSIRLAERNANAGFKKANPTSEMRFKILLADSANEPSISVSRSLDLVQNQGAKALILDTSQADVAVNKTAYDADPANDLNVPTQCGGCTSGTINNKAAIDVDPVTQAALRNTKGWNFRSIMSTKLISQILVRLMLQNNGGDVNGDGKFKITYVGSDETFGRGAIKDLKTFAAQLHPTPAPIIEELYHPRDADPNSFDWGDLARQTSDNQTNGTPDGAPDYVVIANFAQQQAAFVRAYKQGGYPAPMLHYHTFRISAALQSLGSIGDGEMGVSHVLLDGAGGDTFLQEYEAYYGIPAVYRDAIYYDAALTLLLATVIASEGLPDRTLVTGDKVRDAMKKLSDPTGEPVGTGSDEFARAVGLIAAGKAINYQGASGPMDYDANGNVVGRLAQYKANNGEFVDVARFDCVKDPLCPLMPQQ